MFIDTKLCEPILNGVFVWSFGRFVWFSVELIHALGFQSEKMPRRDDVEQPRAFFFPFCTIHVNLIQLGEIWQQRACMHTHPCIFMYVRVRREYKVYVWAHRSSICYIHPFFGISGDAIQLQPTRLHDSTHTNLNALKPSIATVLSILPFFPTIHSFCFFIDFSLLSIESMWFLLLFPLKFYFKAKK